MKGIRYFMRNFTATAVKEHLRAQIEDASSPELTPREIELVRFVRDRTNDWDALPATRSAGASGRG